MRFTTLSLIGLLSVSGIASAQQKKSFISPEMAFSRELFPKTDSVQMPRLLLMQQRTPTVQSLQVKSSLPADYDWSKDQRRIERIKSAAYDQYQNQFDPLGRSPLPDAAKDAVQRVYMKSSTP